MKNYYKTGQALVSLIVFVTIAGTITTAAVTVAIITARSGDNFTQGNNALVTAQSGAENAIIRLLRDPNYTGETINIGSDSVTINISGTNPKTIVATSSVGNFKRKVEVIGTYSNNTFSINTWKEIN